MSTIPTIAKKFEVKKAGAKILKKPFTLHRNQTISKANFSYLRVWTEVEKVVKEIIQTY